MNNITIRHLLLAFLPVFLIAGAQNAVAQKKQARDKYWRILITMDGREKNSKADDPNEPWAKNAPTSLKQRMVDEFCPSRARLGLAKRYAGKLWTGK